MKKIFVFLCLLSFTFSLPIFAQGKEAAKKEPSYKEIQKEVYQLIESWYHWRAKIKKMNKEELKKIIDHHDLDPKLAKASHANLFHKTNKSLQKMLRTTENVDCAMAEYVKMFRGVFGSNIGQNFLYQVRLHQLSRKLHGECLEFWGYLYNRYYFLTNQDKKKGAKTAPQKEEKPSELKLPEYAPRVNLIDALLYSMQNECQKTQELRKEWGKAFQAIDKLPADVRGKLQKYYEHKGCTLGKDCPFNLMGLTMKDTFLMLHRSMVIQKRIDGWMKKHPKTAARVPMDLMQLGHNRAELVSKSAHLVKMMGHGYYKLVGKPDPMKMEKSHGKKTSGKKAAVKKPK